MWWSSINNTIGFQPNLEAPRCLPCNYSTYGKVRETHKFHRWSSSNSSFQSMDVCRAGKKPVGEMRFNAPEGCPCTPQLLCAADRRQVFDAECNIPLHPVRTFSMHGGAGRLNDLQISFQFHGREHVLNPRLAGTGGILSLGLLQAVSLKQMEDCIRDLGHSTGRVSRIHPKIQWHTRSCPIVIILACDLDCFGCSLI